LIKKKWINPSTVAQQAKAGLDAFQASNFSLPSREAGVEMVVSPKGWQPPFPPGSIKINWDASINKLNFGLYWYWSCGSGLCRESFGSQMLI
jgi:hypothetical protein